MRHDPKLADVLLVWLILLVIVLVGGIVLTY